MVYVVNKVKIKKGKYTKRIGQLLQKVVLIQLEYIPKVEKKR